MLDMHQNDSIANCSDPQWIEIGRIVAPQGLRGEVKVLPASDFPERFVQLGQRWLMRPGASEPEAIELQRGRYLSNKGLYVVQFAGIETRNQAEALRGATLIVPASDRPPLAVGEFHLLDLVGLTVFDRHNQDVVGTVVSIASAGNDLLEVKLQHNPETTVLVPFVKEIVTLVDLSNHRIEIAPPSGLLNLNQPQKQQPST